MNFNGGGVIVLDCNGTINTTQGLINSPHLAERLLTVRPMAPFALHDLCTKLDIPSTVINYVDRWDLTELVELLSQWCTYHRLERITIACSALFTSNGIASVPMFRDLVLEMKSRYDVTLILGGPLASPHHTEWNEVKPDVIFQGRSIHLFEDWLKGESKEEYRNEQNGITTYKNFKAAVVGEDKAVPTEHPIVPRLYDDYALGETDVIQFETRLGCKFNCTFCNFEFRGAKKAHDAKSECLYTMFTDAKEKYNVTRFASCDDTFNEDEDKIDLLLSATDRLSYKPKIIGFNRFDILMAKPETVAKLDRAGFVGHYFGIESLHPAAGKMIRKKINREKSLNFLEHLRTDYPHWYLTSGYITGLPGEPLEHNWSVLKEIRKRKLLDAVVGTVLTLWQISGLPENESEMTRHPERFGITVKNKKPEGAIFDNMHVINWEHEHTDFSSAVQMHHRIPGFMRKGGITEVGSWEIIQRDAIGDIDFFDADSKKEYFDEVAKDINKMWEPKWQEFAVQHYNNYIERKKQYHLTNFT
jgi:radical SAM superfamily enzyme YgiQ (UPF0313 family)